MENMERYLKPTSLVDSNHPDVIDFTKKCLGDETDSVKQAILLFYAIRDGFLYNPFKVDLTEEGLKASNLLKRDSGYCVEKANLLGACARVLGIPSRFGFADVINHFSSERLTKALRSNVFAFHGFTELFLNGKWVKATPAFNKSLCDKIGVPALDFDGKEDAIFQQFSPTGQQFMEYINDHGTFDDIPRKYFIETLNKNYPHLFDDSLVISMGADGIFNFQNK